MALFVKNKTIKTINLRSLTLYNHIESFGINLALMLNYNRRHQFLWAVIHFG